MARKLTPKQKAFVEAYVEDPSGKRAAKKAGYEGGDATLAQVGYENLKKPAIRAAIDEMLAARALRPVEILDKLSKQANGSMGDFLSKDEEGRVMVDLDKAEALGALDLIERLVIRDLTGADGRRQQRIDIKLYNSQRALVHLGKVYDMFRSGTGGRRDALPPHEVDDPGNVNIYQKDHSKQLVAAISRFIKETFGNDMASGAFWRAVVYGFVPNPVEHGLPEGLKPSTALEGFMKLEQFYLFCIETTTKELRGLKREPEEIYRNALKFGFVEGPYTEGRFELTGGIVDEGDGENFD